jgi:hypothetical protein
MAEKNGRPFALLSYVQGDAIGSDVVLLETLGASRTFRFSHLPQQQACTNSGPTCQESAARDSRHGTHNLLSSRCDGRHVLSEADF